MKITKEQINQLPQLDRVELLLKEISINIILNRLLIAGLLLFMFSIIISFLYGVVPLIIQILGWLIIYKIFKTWKVKQSIPDKYFSIQVKRNERGNKK